MSAVVEQIAQEAFLQVGAWALVGGSGWVAAYFLWRHVQRMHGEVLTTLKDNTVALTKLAVLIETR